MSGKIRIGINDRGNGKNFTFIFRHLWNLIVAQLSDMGPNQLLLGMLMSSINKDLPSSWMTL